MPELTRTLTFHEDPGHGWLAVPLTEIVHLGIEAEISTCSFIVGQHAYLEEDMDAPHYLAARVAQGHPQPILESQYHTHFNRNQPRFGDPQFDDTFWGRHREAAHA